MLEKARNFVYENDPIQEEMVDDPDEQIQTLKIDKERIEERLVSAKVTRILFGKWTRDNERETQLCHK